MKKDPSQLLWALGKALVLLRPLLPIAVMGDQEVQIVEPLPKWSEQGTWGGDHGHSAPMKTYT